MVFSVAIDRLVGATSRCLLGVLSVVEGGLEPTKTLILVLALGLIMLEVVSGSQAWACLKAWKAFIVIIAYKLTIPCKFQVSANRIITITTLVDSDQLQATQVELGSAQHVSFRTSALLRLLYFGPEIRFQNKEFRS